MTKVPTKHGLRGRGEHLALIARELDLEIASHVERSSAMEQRATILIGAASVVGALQITSTFSWFTVVNLIFSFLAAAAGVIVVFPRRGAALDVRPMRDSVLKLPLLTARYRVIDTKLEILEEDEKWLSVRGWIARIGFSVLAASIAVSLWSAFTPETTNVPTPAGPARSVSPR
jgi:hypothetical protein